jgi:PIN domain nuclease of toxin-antitoxin system
MRAPRSTDFACCAQRAAASLIAADTLTKIRAYSERSACSGSALALEEGSPALTTDRAWSELDVGVQVRTLR